MESKRRQHETLRVQLEHERASFLQHWRDLGDFIAPRRPRFFAGDVNRGDKRNQKIIDSTASLALRTLRSGMMSGITSPARPWFRLTTPDPKMAEIGTVKEWLSLVTTIMTTHFLKSNLYSALPQVYGDAGGFGTAALFMEEDMDEVFRFYPQAVGSYSLALNQKLKVDTYVRTFQMTVRQLINKFGRKDEQTGKPDWSIFSTQVRSLFDQGNYEQWIEVCHIVQPNPEFDPSRLESKFKKYISCYYESGAMKDSNYMSTNDNDVKLLSEKGYDHFPVLAPRWEVTGEDVYGTDCPGMVALGDIKQLQIGERRAAQAIDKMINPPMTGPTSLRNSKATILPGDITYVDDRQGGGGFRPAHEVNFRLDMLEQKQAQVRQRIQRAFFEDLFLMLASSDRRQITAREIDERHEEKLLALGPVLEQMNQDLLDPLIDNAFDFLVKQDRLPPPPKELSGIPLKIEYISIMAQAQKLVGIGGIERFMGFAANVIASSPSAADKIDVDQTLDIYADLTSIPPGIVRSDEDVENMRAERAQASADQAKQEQMMGAAQVAKDLSQTSLEGKTALNELMNSAEAGALTE